MASTFIQPGGTLTLPAPYDVVAGGGALIGSLFGVATTPHDNGEAGEFVTHGVWSLAKASAQAWTVGAKVYWDNTAKVCTTTSTSNTLIGCATEAAANPSSTGTVRLNGTVA